MNLYTVTGPKGETVVEAMGKFDACNDRYELDTGFYAPVAQELEVSPGIVALRYPGGWFYRAEHIEPL